MMRYLAFLLMMLMTTQLAFGQQRVVVVLDDSGSMGDRMSGGLTRMRAAKQSLIAVLNQLEPNDEVGIILLNRGWLVPLSPVNMDNLTRNINSISEGGGTYLGAAMKDGTDALLASRKKNITGEYRLLVVTDGEANDSSKVATYTSDILSRGIIIDVIGVGMDKDHQLAHRVHVYRRADDADSLHQALQETFAESTGIARDGQESDFDIIRPLPDEMALGILTALADMPNHPIGESPDAGGNSSASGASGGSPVCLGVSIGMLSMVTICIVFGIRKQ